MIDIKKELEKELNNLTKKEVIFRKKIGNILKVQILLICLSLLSAIINPTYITITSIILITIMVTITIVIYINTLKLFKRTKKEMNERL